MKVKLCFTNFALLLTLLFNNACDANKPISKEAARFEKVLKETGHSDKAERVKYILWNENSCYGCKIKTLNILIENRFDHVKIIAPLSDKKLASNIDSQFIIIDKTRSFGKYYYGISNVGIISVIKGKVKNIKNYSLDEMESFEADLNNL